MASHRVGETTTTGLPDSGPNSNHHHHHNHHHVLHHNSQTSFFNHQEGGSGSGSSAFDFGELEEAIVLQGVDEQPLFTPGRSAATLEMFPSWPMRFQQTPRGSSKSGCESTEEEDDSGSGGVNTTFTTSNNNKSTDFVLTEEPESPMSQSNNLQQQAFVDQQHQQHMIIMDTPVAQIQQQQQNQNTTNKLPQQEKRRGSGGSTSEKPLDTKTLRRLAQNREAARKSRLRKKAYVQQLETSRIKLTQIEQDLQRARSQGLFMGGCGGAGGNISSGAAIFDMEYARWLEDDNRHMSELRTGLHAHMSDSDLSLIVDGYISHFDEIFRLKGVAAKADVFHLLTGMWTTPAERCFLWMGGFRPSELIKMLISQLDPLTEQQLMGIYSLQQSSQQAEEALSQGLDQLQQSLIDTVAGGPPIDGMQQMAVALGKLSNLEGFVRQADNLRQQTLHQLRRILTVRQAARCFLVIGQYYGRLRALSSLWASRPRE
ncbi:hypothetical protein ACFE04_027502 [Oxalis oulophora]